MKTSLIVLLINLTLQNSISQTVKTEKKQDTITTVVDSLSFTYDPKILTILVDDKIVHYSVVFNIEKEITNPRYRLVGGSMNPFDAIKRYGEKYRKGILAYKKEREEDYE